MFGSSSGDVILGLLCVKVPYPPIVNESHVTKKYSFFILDALKSARNIPLEIHPLELLVQTSLIIDFNAHLELFVEFNGEPFRSLQPSALRTTPGCLQRPQQAAVARIHAQAFPPAFIFYSRESPPDPPTVLCTWRDVSGCRLHRLREP